MDVSLTEVEPPAGVTPDFAAGAAVVVAATAAEDADAAAAAASMAAGAATAAADDAARAASTAVGVAIDVETVDDRVTRLEEQLSGFREDVLEALTRGTTTVVDDGAPPKIEPDGEPEPPAAPKPKRTRGDRVNRIWGRRT